MTLTFAREFALHRLQAIPVEAALAVVAIPAHRIMLTIQANTAGLLFATKLI